MVIEEVNPNVTSGIEELESDTELYNLLVQAKEDGDPILGLYNIKYIDKNYAEAPSTLDVNNMYIIRLESDLERRGNTFQEFNVTLQIVLAIREYDTITAQKLLKTTYKRIMYHLVNDQLSSFIKVNQHTLEYEFPGILNKMVIEFDATELEDFQYKTDIQDLLVRLGIKTTIDDEKEYIGEFKQHE